MADAIDASLDSYRDLRSRLEQEVRPVARSLDGRSFAFQAPVAMPLQPGGYVRLELAEGPVLGQVIDSELTLVDGPEMDSSQDDAVRYRTRVRFHAVSGRGTTLGPAGPFHDAPVTEAAPEVVAAWLDAADPASARLPVGEMTFAPGVPARITAAGFDRHTFLCGQSGSGKSYALSVILEQLLLETELRIVVLDPNSDFVRLREPAAGAAPDLAVRWSALADRIWIRTAAEGDDRLQLRFAHLDARTQAAVAGLDPLADREEYGALLTLLERERSGVALDELLVQLETGEPDMRALGMRIRNLGVLGWPVWPLRQGARGLLDDLDAEDWRLLVVDLGSVTNEAERAMVAEAVLARLWERRARRRPVLCVIDEAHNVCPQHPADPLTALATEHAVRIAGEGRKFGIHLLVSTQRPGKVHENVLSQCDNLVLMKMNAAGDIAHLSELFSFAPSPLVARSSVFRQGESLVAGKIAGQPMFVRFGGRVAREGGGDVAADWAAVR
jgi:DNA helicase HerA-like ATPase